jgi:hypothetical protein
LVVIRTGKNFPVRHVNSHLSFALSNPVSRDIESTAMRTNIVTVSILAFLFPLATAGQHADVKPNVQGGRIVIDGYIDDTGETIPGLRVFGFEFQEDPLDPYVSSDPGFNTVGGSSLPPASQLSFSVPGAALFGLPANLTYWSGTGLVSFGAAPSGETLRLNRGTQDRTIGSGTGPITGFAIGAVGGNGSIHDHLNSFLQGSDGNVNPGDGIVPADGIYLVSLELTSSDPLIAASRPIFLVYNNGLDEAAHDTAIDWVETNLVPIPEPSSVSLGVMGMLILGVMSARFAGGGRLKRTFN